MPSANQKTVKLHLGCGETYLPGWINVDTPQADGSHSNIKTDLNADISTMEYQEAAVDEILMNAVFEHFQRHEALRILRKFYKWLRVGGKITIVVPDFWGSIKKLKQSKSDEERSFWYRHLFGPQDHPQYGNHLDGFDKTRLRKIFNVAGFTDLSVESFGFMPFLRVIATKTSNSSDEDFKKNAAIYLSYHEYNGKVDSCFNEWLKALKIEKASVAADLPAPHFKTQGVSLQDQSKQLVRKLFGERFFQFLKRFRK